ncbi:MAG: hypothetical protein WC340_15065 [Kiritimatiellia bacterium]
MKVHWTKTASDHLEAIYAYIAQCSEEYAIKPDQIDVIAVLHGAQKIL